MTTDKKIALMNAATKVLERALKMPPNGMAEEYNTGRLLAEYMEIQTLNIEEKKKERLLNAPYERILNNLKSFPDERASNHDVVEELIQVIKSIDSLEVEEQQTNK
mgnify:FL=1